MYHVRYFLLVRVAVFLLLYDAAGLAAADVAGFNLVLDTRQDRDGYYVTTGILDLARSPEAVRKTLLDFGTWGRWAPKRQDGKDPVSEKFVGQLKGLSYKPAESELWMSYDVNLIWPFGSRGNVARLGVVHRQEAVDGLDRGGRQATVVALTLLDQSIALEGVLIELAVSPAVGGGTRVTFVSRVKLAWFMRPFFPLEAYRKFMENRVGITLGNFAEAVSAGGAPTAVP